LNYCINLWILAMVHGKILKLIFEANLKCYSLKCKAKAMV